MKINDRTKFIEDLAELMADTMNLDDLIQYYYEGTIEYLNGLSEEELLDEAKWSGFEPEELLGE